jgi:hypothetical protein
MSAERSAKRSHIGLLIFWALKGGSRRLHRRFAMNCSAFSVDYRDTLAARIASVDPPSAALAGASISGCGISEGLLLDKSLIANLRTKSSSVSAVTFRVVLKRLFVLDLSDSGVIDSGRQPETLRWTARYSPSSGWASSERKVRCTSLSKDEE